VLQSFLFQLLKQLYFIQLQSVQSEIPLNNKQSRGNLKPDLFVNGDSRAKKGSKADSRMSIQFVITRKSFA
jgi:hypothetical protein